MLTGGVEYTVVQYTTRHKGAPVTCLKDTRSGHTGATAALRAAKLGRNQFRRKTRFKEPGPMRCRGLSFSSIFDACKIDVSSDFSHLVLSSQLNQIPKPSVPQQCSNV